MNYMWATQYEKSYEVYRMKEEGIKLIRLPYNGTAPKIRELLPV